MHRSPNYLGRHRFLVKSKRSYQVVSPTGKTHFESPATLNGVVKIYLLGKEDKLHYVGITRQSMARRLNYGMKANGKNGYHGYAWKNELGKYDLDVWQFSLKKTDDSADLAEAVEAEIAFRYRNQSGKWPLYQTEIHFSNQFDGLQPLPRDIAKRILARFYRGSSSQIGSQI